MPKSALILLPLLLFGLAVSAGCSQDAGVAATLAGHSASSASSAPAFAPVTTQADPVSTGKPASTSTSAASGNGPSESDSRPAAIDGWTVEIIGIAPDADEAVAAHSEFNDPPQPGSHYVTVRLRVTRTAEAAAVFGESVYCSYIGGSGAEFAAAPEDILDDLREASAVKSGGSLTGDLVFEVPSTEIQGGRLAVEAVSSPVQSRVVMPLQ